MNIVHFTLGSVNPSSANGVNKVIAGLSKYCNKSIDVNTIVLTLSKKQKHSIKKYFTNIYIYIKFQKSYVYKMLHLIVNKSNQIGNNRNINSTFV